jgi:hypothetical protein
MRQGIDGIYRNATPPPDFIIVETKFTSNIDRIPTLRGTADGGRQMDTRWIANRVYDAIDGSQLARQIARDVKAGNTSNIMSVAYPDVTVKFFTIDSTGRVIK